MIPACGMEPAGMPVSPSIAPGTEKLAVVECSALERSKGRQL